MKRFKNISKLLNKISFQNKTNFLIFLIAGGMLSIMMLAELSLFSLKYDFDTLYKKRTVPLVQLEEIKDLYKVNVYDTLFDLQQDIIKYPQAKEVISLAKQIIKKNWIKFNDSLKNEKKPFFYFFTDIAQKYLLKNEGQENFKILQNSMLKNIEKKMKEIDKEIRTILLLKKEGENNHAKVLLKKLYLNIGLSNIYLTNLINFDLKKAALEKRRTSKVFYFTFGISLLFIVVIFIVSILSSVFIMDNFRELHNSLEKKVNEKTKELQKLNKNLEIRVQKEVENNRKKDRIMFQQAKLASLGEMLQNIAHQWRQPLGSLSLIIQSFQTKNMVGKLTDEFIEEKVNDGLKIAQNMSATIDDFRNFFNPDKTKRYFTIKECIEHSLELTKYLLEKKGIEVYMLADRDMLLYSYFNELSHVFLNIIKNSEDALSKKEIKEKKIFIISKKSRGFAIISIIDNGGGIPESIKNKIFEPYFTTKHKSSGTGVGLYMSKQIVEKHLQGSIKYENIKHRLGTKKMYDCAMFEIKIPLNNKEINNEQ
jgi:signal transduction histidine kinase